MGPGQGMRWREERNRKIYSAYQAGRSISQLSQDFHLRPDRVRVILAEERNKQSFSPQPYYRTLRKNQSRG